MAFFAVVPTVGLVGLGAGAFIGTYDVTSKATRLVFSVHNPSKTTKTMGFTAGAGTAIAFVGVREVFFKPPTLNVPSAIDAHSTVGTVRRLADQIRNFPLRFRAINVFGAAALMAVTSTVTQHYHQKSRDPRTHLKRLQKQVDDAKAQLASVEAAKNPPQQLDKEAMAPPAVPAPPAAVGSTGKPKH